MVSAAGAVQFIVFCLTLTGELGSTRKKFEDYISRSTRSMLPETQSMLLTCSVFDLQGVPLNTTAEESLSAPTNPCLLGSSVGIAGEATSFFGMPQLDNVTVLYIPGPKAHIA